MEMAVAPLNRIEKLNFSIECAERVLHLWDEFDPKDRRPYEAVVAARRSLVDAVSKEEVERAGILASDAAVRASMVYDQIENLNTIDQASPIGQSAARAEWAAVSASHAALTAAAVDDEIDYCCAYAAKAAFKATMECEAERIWQESRLAAYLMGRPI
jgi:hypothetical protein